MKRMSRFTLIIAIAFITASCAQIKDQDLIGEWKQESPEAITFLKFDPEGKGSITVLDKDNKVCRIAEMYWEIRGNQIVAKEYIPDDLAEVWINHKFKFSKANNTVLLGNIYEKSVKVQ